MAYVPFVVRAPLDERAAILVHMGVNTAQAYNHWGGKSLYPSNSTDREPAVKVSFDRPFEAWRWANANSRWPFSWDYQLTRFLEREGFDVAYTTDVDTHREPWTMIGHRLLMLSGHDEYWTTEMVDALEDALEMGANLACMGANAIYWQARYEDRERTLVEYRSEHRDPESDATRKTIRFRDLRCPRPECRLLGVQYQDGLTPAMEPAPAALPGASRRGRRPLVAGDGLRGRRRKLHGLVGYEWDGPAEGPRDPEELCAPLRTRERARTTPTRCATRLPCGALVFASGSMQFAWGLDDSRDHDGSTRTRGCSSSCATRSPI